VKIISRLLVEGCQRATLTVYPVNERAPVRAYIPRA